MQEFEPKKKTKILTKEFLAKYAYVFVIGILLIGGISYGYTFFIQNRKIASGSITTAALTINFTDRSINASSLSVPNDNQEGMSEYSKSVTITNQTAIDGRVKLTLTRTSGLDLTDMSYALIVNGAIQEIDDVPSDGEIFSSAIMGGSPTGETIEVEVRLWPKTTYTGSETTFVGELTPEVKYLGNVASNISSPAGKYVNFNCSSTCEVWQIVKVEDDRLVLTRQADYTNATSRTNSNRYNPSSFNPVLTFNDDSLIYSLSTDGKNVYLAKTVKVTGGSGTQADPYNLANEIFREDDKKVQAVITYKQNTTTLGTQNLYYGETNYVGRDAPSPYSGWSDGTNRYVLGDTIPFTIDTNLTALQVQAVNLSFDNTTTSFNCTDAQCAIRELNWLVDPQQATTYISSLLTDTNAAGNKVYTGADPDNYVWFNNEQWRIIGVYGNNLKIMKATPSILPSSQVPWSNQLSSNTWDNSSVKNDYLYGTYYPTLSNDAVSMIEENSTWHVGIANDNTDNAAAAYASESSTTWTGKIGLIATYEYLYAAENDGTCWTTNGSTYYSSCASKDWMTVSLINGGTRCAWTLTLQSSGNALVVGLYGEGFVGTYSPTSNGITTPVVYLKSNVQIVGGNGQAGEANSYKLALAN